MNKEVLATILGLAGISVFKKVSGSKNQEKPFTFTMTFYLEGENGPLTRTNYENNIVHPDWLQAVDDFIEGTRFFLKYREDEEPRDMLIQYRQDLHDENPTFVGEAIDKWLTGYMYEQGEWEEYVNTTEDLAIQWISPSHTRILGGTVTQRAYLEFTYHFDLDQIEFFIKRFYKYGNQKASLRAVIAWKLRTVIEDWIIILGYYGNYHREFDRQSIEEAEIFIMDTELEVDLSLIEPSKRRLVEAMVKEEQKSELRKF